MFCRSFLTEKFAFASGNTLEFSLFQVNFNVNFRFISGGEWELLLIALGFLFG